MINKSNYPIFLGSILSQIVTLFTTYLLLFKSEPHIYGQFTFYLSIISIVSSLSTLKFEQGIAISRTNDEVINKVLLIFILNLVITTIFIGFYSFFDALSFQLIVLFFVLSFSIVASASFQQVFLYYNLHLYNGLLTFLIALINLLLLFFFIKIENGFLISYTLGYFLSTSIVILIFSKKVFSVDFSKINIKDTFLSNKNYPYYVFPSAIITVLLTYYHPIVLKFIYDESTVGLFSVSLRILLLPTIVFGAILGGLFRAKLAKLMFDNRLEDVRIEIYKNFKFLLISALFGFPILIFAIFLFVKYFNISSWKNLDYVSLFLCGYALSQYLFVPLSNIPLVLNRNSVLLKSNVIIFIANILLFAFAYFFTINFLTFLLILSVVNIIVVLIFIRIFIKLAK